MSEAVPPAKTEAEATGLDDRDDVEPAKASPGQVDTAAMSVVDLPQDRAASPRPSMAAARTDAARARASARPALRSGLTGPVMRAREDIPSSADPSQGRLAAQVLPQNPRATGKTRRVGAEGAPAAPRAPARPSSVSFSPATQALRGAPLASQLDDASNDFDGTVPLKAPATVQLSPRMTAIFGGIFGLATLTSLVALLIQGDPPRNERALLGGASATTSASAAEAPRAVPVVKKRVRVAIPGPWRLSELEKEPGVTIDRGTMDKRTLFDALGEKGLPKSEIYRIMKALEGIRAFDKSHKKDRFAIAHAGKKVRAFEYEVSPSEIYQAREGEGGRLAGSKLDMKLGEEEFSGSVYVGSDLAASFKAAGFEDGILAALDEALSGHMSTESFEEGGTVRVVAVEETALGLFSRYKRIVAMEYKPLDPAGKAIRVYTFNGQEARGYWDDKGHQPSSGGWRSPVPGAPVTSHFNPKRMHPVLHTIMPHTGTDFGAPSGAPIYAAYKGVIESAGPLGPCGNAVVINHPGGITTGYCHMSKFGNVKAGEHVGTHQLIGYVGKTGRATGPHLHFFAKKNGVFFDALTLHLDGDRPVPTVDRTDFLAAKAELDKRLDAIALPEVPPEPEKPAVAAASSASSEPADGPPPGKDNGGKGSKEPKEPTRVASSHRSAAQIGSPEALAAARAEPGIHPSQLVEVKGDEDEDVSPPTGGPTAAPAPSGGKTKKPDPADDDPDNE